MYLQNIYFMQLFDVVIEILQSILQGNRKQNRIYGEMNFTNKKKLNLRIHKKNYQGIDDQDCRVNRIGEYI